MGIGPVPAVATAPRAGGRGLGRRGPPRDQRGVRRAGIACLREWKLGEADLERVNVNGSGISLGHPIGATGGRILANLLRELDRRGARYGLETMCIGGGQGLAALFERIRRERACELTSSTAAQRTQPTSISEENA